MRSPVTRLVPAASAVAAAAVAAFPAAFPALSADADATVLSMAIWSLIFRRRPRRGRLIRSLYAASADPIFIVERRQRTIVHCNPAAETLYGWRRDELVGRESSVLFADQADWRGLPGQYAADLDAGKLVERRVAARHRDGRSFTTRHRVVGFECEGVPYTAVYTYDLSAEEEAHRRLERHAHALNERVKELKCLYGVSEVLSQTERPLEDRIGALPASLKAAWQFPEHAHVRIELAGKTYGEGAVPAASSKPRRS